MILIDSNLIVNESLSKEKDGINLLQANTRFVEEMVKK